MSVPSACPSISVNSNSTGSKINNSNPFPDQPPPNPYFLLSLFHLSHYRQRRVKPASLVECLQSNYNILISHPVGLQYRKVGLEMLFLQVQQPKATSHDWNFPKRFANSAPLSSYQN